jgi:hypothetical protein
MTEHKQCIAYRAGDRVCANGFFQKPVCHGSVGCWSCGTISEREIPHCLKDELPEHWVTETGLPRLADYALTSSMGKTNDA